MTASVEATEFHGFEALRLTAGGACAIVTLQGGQVLSWCTGDGVERLYLSCRAHLDGVFPIRGGIPVCFPQFSDLGPLPKHGLLRTRSWHPLLERCGDDRAHVTLAISEDEQTLALWPHRFKAELMVDLGADELAVELSVRNTGESAFDFSAALHTYLHLADLPGATLTGLSSLYYRDQADGGILKLDASSQLELTGRIARIYEHCPQPLLLADDPRRLAIAQKGFPDVVLWNPWAELCAVQADMEPDDYLQLLCVEAAIAAAPVVLAVGQRWSGRQTLKALPRIGS